MPKWRILVVDDEPDVRTIISATLSAKYEIVEAQDGLDALEMLERVEPDFAVLDVMMPLMDGIQTCAAIRRHPRYNAMPILFLSALNTRDDMKKGYGAGANLYLTKPFDPARLMRNVDLFFETNAPQFRRKQYTIEQLLELPRKGPEAIASVHEEKTTEMPEESPAAAVEQTATEEQRQEPDAQQQEFPETPRSRSKPQSAESLRPRIAIIEDDLELRTVLENFLNDDYETVLAADGIEAIEKITRYQPDLILLDAMMPKMSGFQICQSLRRNARFSRTPILFISGRATPRDRDYALRIGGTAFLGKPFDMPELKSVLSELLSRPEFRVYPKALSIDSITELENRRKKQIEEKQDRIHRKEENELEKFLRENA